MGKLPGEWQPYVDQLETQVSELEAEVAVSHLQINLLKDTVDRVKALPRYKSILRKNPLNGDCMQHLEENPEGGVVDADELDAAINGEK